MHTPYLKSGWVFLFLFIYTSFLSAQTLRGLHVNDFKYILGDSDKENQLLEFAQQQGFNYLLLYNLGHIHRHLYDLTVAHDAAILANFIEKAKLEYGVKQVGGVGEKYASFIPYFTYNQFYTDLPNRQLDVFSLEFEFWNKNLYGNGEYYCTTYLQEANFPCTQEGAFLFYEEQLERINELVLGTDVLVESYIGNPTDEQSTRLAKLCDRVLVHYYRSSNTYNDGRSIYNYKSNRLTALAAAQKKIDVIPLFNARRQFMGSWLSENEPEQAFSTFLFGQDGYNQQDGDWKEYINIVGYHWYRYSDLAEVITGTDPTITTSTHNIDPSALDVEAFPNPVTDELRLSWTAETQVKYIRVYSRDGQNVFHEPVAKQQHMQVNARDFPKGLLIIMLTTEAGLLQKKVMCK